MLRARWVWFPHHLRLALKMAQAACDRMEHWLMCRNIFHVKQTMADTKM